MVGKDVNVIVFSLRIAMRWKSDIEFYAPNVVISICQKPSEYIDSEDTKRRFWLDVQNGQNSFVQDGVTDGLARFGIGGNLWHTVRENPMAALSILLCRMDKAGERKC